MVFDDTFYNVEHFSKGTVPGNWKNLTEDHSELATQEIFTLAKEWILNKYSKMTQPRDYYQEDPLEPGPQDLPPGYDPQALPRGTTEKPTSTWVTEARSDTTSPCTG